MINQEDSGRRAQILDAALHVMAERGFRGASIKRIAERAGLKSPALIYWYFKDKHALLEGIFQRMSPLLTTIAEAEANSLDAPPQDVLPRVVSSFMSAIEQPHTGRVIRIMMSEFMRHPAVANFFAERGPMVVLRFSSATSCARLSLVACGRTIFQTRLRYDRPGRVLVRFPALLFLFPHLWLTLARMCRAGFARRAIALLPWLFAGEVARIVGFLESRPEARA